MATAEKFCLRWNDFESNISSAFRELREDKDFFDVTLACDDDQIQAHKVILSACSPFFRTVLKRNRHEHPLLYLKGVKYIDLVAVLNFMYHGEVNVAQEELNSFLSIAEELKVKGLTQNNGSENSQSPSPKPSREHKREPPESKTVQQKHGQRDGGRTEAVAVRHLWKVEQAEGGHARPRGVPAPGRRLPLHLPLLQPGDEHEPEAASARVPASDPGEELCDGRASTRAHICLVFLRAILMPLF